MVILSILIGLKLCYYMVGAMWIAGEGNGNLITGFSYVWREQGGIRGFFYLASDLQLARASDSVISEKAASRLLTKRQCEKEDGIIRNLETEKRRNVRRWLLQALAACGSQKAIPVFRESLHSDDEMIILVGAQSLGMLKAREAIPELEAVIGKCGAQCSGSAAFALSMIGDSNIAHSWARKMLSADKPGHDPKSDDFYSRMYAGMILEKIGTVEDIPLIDTNKGSLGVSAESHKQAILSRQPKN